VAFDVFSVEFTTSDIAKTIKRLQKLIALVPRSDEFVIRFDAPIHPLKGNDVCI